MTHEEYKEMIKKQHLSSKQESQFLAKTEHFAKSHYGKKNDSHGIRFYGKMEREKTA